MKLRSHLIILVVAALLPVLIFAGVMIVVFGRQQQRLVEVGLLDTARALSLAVDRELTAWSNILETLASSEHLDSGDLRKFYSQAQRVLETRQDWDTIVLVELPRRQVLNLRRPFGVSLPDVQNSAQLTSVVETRKPVVSDLFSGQVLGKPLVGIAVPVIRAGKVRYVLMSAVSPASLSRLLLQQKLSDEWEAGVIDRNKIIIARTRNIEKFLGKPTGQLLAAKSKESKEAVWRGVMQGGPEVYSALRRSELSGWTVVVGIHATALDAPLRYNLAAAIGGGSALLLVGVVVATVFGRRIANAISSLSNAAAALGHSEMPQTLTSPIIEVNNVARVIEDAATERRHAEESIRRQSRLLDLYFKYALNPVVFLDRDFNFIRVNEAYARACQRDVAEFPGHNHFEFYPSDAKAIFEEVVRTNKPFQTFARPFVFPDHPEWGVTYWDWTLVPILDSTGEIELLVFSLDDVTERKLAQAEIQRNLERIRALHTIALAVTSTLDLKTVLNALLEKIDLFLPYSAATIRLWNEKTRLLEPVACRNINEEEWKAEEWKGGRGSPNTVFETRSIVRIVNCQADTRIRDRDFFRKNNLVSYLGVPLVAHDQILGVTSFYTKEEHEFTDDEIGFSTTLAGQAAIAIHNARLYEQMVKTNKIKDEFLSVMSHELRTPLNVVVGYTGMIRDGMLGKINPQQAEALDKVIRRTNDQLALVNNILFATVLESESIRIESQDFNLEDFLNQLKQDYEAPINKDLSLNWNYPFGLPFIRTDSAKLKHILRNLIDNALKFTAKGSVTVSARITEGNRQQARGNSQQEEGLLTPHASRLTPTWVEFKVADTGAGIPKEHLPFVFDKFRQVDSSETRSFGGVGMGLYIVKQFAELLGGTVEVESEPGKGSTFTVTLPCGQ